MAVFSILEILLLLWIVFPGLFSEEGITGKVNHLP
jgi:hypothetical protein